MTSEHSPAVNLMAEQLEARKRNRERWKKEAAALIDAHQLAFSSVVSMILRFSGRSFDKQSLSVEGRMCLAAQFLQGIEICESSISEGLYSQAAALLKQEMETLTAIDEFENARRKDGKTPNIGHGIIAEFGPVYGDLNNIAHVSRHEIARQLVTVDDAGTCAPSLIPQYNPELARFQYGNHVYFIIEAAKQTARTFQEIFAEGMSTEEDKWIFTALIILLKEKAIKLPPAAKKRFPDIKFDTFPES